TVPAQAAPAAYGEAGERPHRIVDAENATASQRLPSSRVPLLHGNEECPHYHGRLAYSASKRDSRPACTPRMRSTTFLAQSKYSRLRSSDQPAGGAPLMSLTFAILSASFTSFALRLMPAA